MALSNLDVRLPDGPVQLLDPRNQAFLSGTAEPVLGGANPWLLWFGRVAIVGFGGLLLALVVVSAWMVLWSSSLAVPTEATIQVVVGDSVTYSYAVDAAAPASPGRDSPPWPCSPAASGAPTLTTTEASPRRSFYGEEGQTTGIRYLCFAPTWSELDANHEDMDWLTFGGAALFLGALIYAGVVMVREAQRLQRLAANATHVLPGTLVLEIPGPKGSRTYVYELEAPSGGVVRGNVPVGAAVRFPVPSPVAVLYADDRTHMIL